MSEFDTTEAVRLWILQPLMELADKWDKLRLAGEPTTFRNGYEQALKDCAKELRIASGISIEVSVKGGGKRG